MLSLLHDLEEIDPAGLRRDVDGRYRLQYPQVDHLDRPRLGTDALDRDKGIPIIGRDDHAMDDATLRRDPGELASVVRIDDGHRLPTLVRGNQAAVLGDREVVDAVAGGNPSPRCPTVRVDLDN